jgi:hypothetical protein
MHSGFTPGMHQQATFIGETPWLEQVFMENIQTISWPSSWTIIKSIPRRRKLLGDEAPERGIALNAPWMRREE